MNYRHFYTNRNTIKHALSAVGFVTFESFKNGELVYVTNNLIGYLERGQLHLVTKSTDIPKYKLISFGSLLLRNSGKKVKGVSTIEVVAGRNFTGELVYLASVIGKYQSDCWSKLKTRFNVIDVNICNPESRSNNRIVTGNIN